MLGTSLHDCNMSESAEYPQPVAKPLDLPDCLTTTEVKLYCRYYFIATFSEFMELIKTLKELSWHLHSVARNYGLCFIFIVQFQARANRLIQMI